MLNARGLFTVWRQSLHHQSHSSSRLLQRRHISYTEPLQAIEFHKAPLKESGEKSRAPIAILFGWLLAKSRHLEKYGNIYRCHGADVITCKLEVMEVLRPAMAERVASKVLDILMKPENMHRPVIIHGFSVGGYMYSQVLNKLVTEPKYASVKAQIKGHIFDSLVDFDGIPSGVSTAASDNKLVQMSLKTAITSYLSLTEKYTTKVYRQRSELFFQPPITVPSLLLYSLDDPVAAASRIDSLAQHWQEQGIDVRQKHWAKSPHVSHMYSHMDEYIEEVVRFLKQINIFDAVYDRDTIKANM